MNITLVLCTFGAVLARQHKSPALVRGASTRHVSCEFGTESTQGHHCSTKLNPADDDTRRLPVSSITLSSQWLNGRRP